MNKVRCGWAGSGNSRMLAYHDEEWGLPCHDETRLFELLSRGRDRLGGAAESFERVGWDFRRHVFRFWFLKIA